MRWWCSSQSVAWDWAWRPYVGVWLFIAMLAVVYIRHLRRIQVEPRPVASRGGRRERIWFFAGLMTLWVALDWPVGPLGASYLASLHMVQFLLVSLVAPPLLLLGLSAESFERLRGNARLMDFLENVTRPAAAFFIFNIVMSVTHWPSIVDGLRTSQMGSFVLDITWLVIGLIFWWPLICPVPERRQFHAIWKIGYLGLNAAVIRPPTLILLYSKYPAYSIYELAPPIQGITAIADQQLAGVIMKAGSAWIMLIAMTIVYIVWRRAIRYGTTPTATAIKNPVSRTNDPESRG